MALFGNGNKKTIEELENYYANKPQKSGMAWVMAFLSLIITVTVLGGLFFGGRLLYRTITDESDETVATTLDESNGASSTNSGGDIVSTNTGDDTTEGVVSDEAASTSTPSAADNSTDEMSTAETDDENDSDDTDDADDVDTQTTTALVTTGDSSANDSATLGVEVDDSNELPNTGAGEILIIAPLTALVAGIYVSRQKQIRD